MASVELRTPRQRLVALLALVGIWAVLMPPMPAYAGTVISPPPYLTCNVGVDRSTPGPTSGTFTTNYKCNHPPGTFSHMKVFVSSSTDGLSDGNESSITAGGAGQEYGSHTQAGYNAPYQTQTFVSCSVQAETPTGTLRTGGTNTACTFQGVQTATWPNNYYSGGTDGNPPEDATVGTPTCARTLTDTSQMTGEFTSATSGGANITSSYTWDWNWGDAATHGTTQNANHTYGALSTMPHDGWTAVVTWTYNATGGHAFTGGGTTATATCSLRVDFLHPENSTPSSSGGGSTGEDGLDDCVPSGWSVLNPFAFIGGLGCVFEFLFIPQEDSINDLTSLWDDASTKAPFSVVADVVTYLPGMFEDMKHEIHCASPTGGCGVVTAIDRSPLCDIPTLGLCAGANYPLANTAFDPNSDNYSDAVGAMRTVFLFLLAGVFVYACWRGSAEILK